MILFKWNWWDGLQKILHEPNALTIAAPFLVSTPDALRVQSGGVQLAKDVLGCILVDGKNVCPFFFVCCTSALIT
jgi:hypothetical protein